MFTLITFKSINLLSPPKSLLQILINLTNYVKSIAKLRPSVCESQKNSGAVPPNPFFSSINGAARHHIHKLQVLPPGQVEMMNLRDCI